MLVAIGCDMARQCHLDTCPTGIATQREDLRAKFAGTPEQVERFATALAEDLRRELAAVGAPSVGELVGEAGRYLAPVPVSRGRTLDLTRVLGAPRWEASAARRAAPGSAGRDVPRQPASPLETRLVAALRGQAGFSGRRACALDGRPVVRCRPVRRPRARRAPGPIRLELRGAAGQSFGAFAGPALDLRLVGQANDYVGKGLSGGRLLVKPEPDLAAQANRQASPATPACTARPAAGSTSSVGQGCASPSATPAPRPSSRVSARTAAST